MYYLIPKSTATLRSITVEDSSNGKKLFSINDKAHGFEKHSKYSIQDIFGIIFSKSVYRRTRILFKVFRLFLYGSKQFNLYKKNCYSRLGWAEN